MQGDCNVWAGQFERDHMPVRPSTRARCAIKVLHFSIQKLEKNKRAGSQHPAIIWVLVLEFQSTQKMFRTRADRPTRVQRPGTAVVLEYYGPCSTAVLDAGHSYLYK